MLSAFPSFSLDFPGDTSLPYWLCWPARFQPAFAGGHARPKQGAAEPRQNPLRFTLSWPSFLSLSCCHLSVFMVPTTKTRSCLGPSLILETSSPLTSLSARCTVGRARLGKPLCCSWPGFCFLGWWNRTFFSPGLSYFCSCRTIFSEIILSVWVLGMNICRENCVPFLTNFVGQDFSTAWLFACPPLFPTFRAVQEMLVRPLLPK